MHLLPLVSSMQLMQKNMLPPIQKQHHSGLKLQIICWADSYAIVIKHIIVGNDAGASPRLNHKDALAAIRGGRIPPPESMPSFEEVKEVLGFNSYYEVVYTVFKGQLKMQNQKNQSPQDPIVEVITPEVYNNYGADGFNDSFFGMQQNCRKRAKSS